ncbi:MAG: ABC transporter permease [Chloroflexi bacterium]|nr:ABC transporter permease [Chloroflexota bacterium]
MTTSVPRRSVTRVARRLMPALQPVALALIVTLVIIVLVGASPLAVLAGMWDGAFGDADRQADVLAAWVPLTLATVGLLVTFTAGLWNIGIEGQITLGAIGATFVVRTLPDLPAPLLLSLVLLSAAVAGGLWGLIVGALKTYGKVHEIFGGMGLNFVAIGLTNYLIFGPWKQAGRASASGTEPYPLNAYLPTLEGLRLSPYALGLAIVALLIVYVALRGTTWGLQLKAIGKSLRAAHWLGIATERQILLAFVVAGACAGLAGAVQTTVTYHRLIPSISSGYGYLAILVALLAGFRALWVAPLAFFFAALSLGSRTLQMQLQLDSSLGGVIQGVLVLIVVLARGLGTRSGNTET